MIFLNEENEIIVIEKDVQYLYDTIKPMTISFRGSANTEINTKLLDTSEIKDMSFIFAEMKNVENIDLSSFDTSNATTMTAMFYNSTFKNLDLSSFDTSKVTMMNAMFQACRNLTDLDISNFDTINVTNMSDMFMFCQNLKELDLSNFDTSNVTTMGRMFLENNNLIEVKGYLDMSNVVTTGSMLSYCQNLKEIRLKNLKNNLDLTTASALSSESINYLLMNVQKVDSKTISLGSNLSKASEDSIENATMKGWTIN